MLIPTQLNFQSRRKPISSYIYRMNIREVHRLCQILYQQYSYRLRQQNNGQLQLKCSLQKVATLYTFACLQLLNFHFYQKHSKCKHFFSLQFLEDKKESQDYLMCVFHECMQVYAYRFVHTEKISFHFLYDIK